MRRWAAVVVLGIGLGATPSPALAGWTLVGWNNLGMHCMDDDYSVFSILPPYNVVHAQLSDPSGSLVRDAAGIRVSYEAVADPNGSIDTTSAGKTNFWEFVEDLFGAALAPDEGLAGFDMPGPANTPQAMRFEPERSWWIADGVPITPTDDSGRTNPYPLLRLTARDAAGHVLATTDVVLPVSTEMTCLACHASGANEAARPASGWVGDPTPAVDYRLNILRLHDERRVGPSYASVLEAAGYDPTGLEATAAAGTSVLCARCHASNALPDVTVSDRGSLTHVVHAVHASVVDPATGVSLGSESNRSACYNCHPGSTTRCLRGAMGSAVAPDGSLAMQCQSCHGGMAMVGAAGRDGWLDEPTCQNCHTGTATHNSGEIRYTSVYDGTGARRVAADDRFATTPDQPAPGLSLYRFSTGHGGLACEGCHGSTHAEFPSSHENDNLQSIALQGHAGMLSDCTACHDSVPFTASGGPHGMHTIGAAWVREHGDLVEDGGSAACRSCHGADYRGSELSDALGDRSFDSELGHRSFFRGARVTCYSCHAGPGSDDATNNRPPVAESASASTPVGVAVSLALVARDAEHRPLVWRIISQPAHGTVGLSGNVARYFPEPGFLGTDRFTWSAFDGSIDSSLATATLIVGGAPSPAPGVTKLRSARGPFRILLKGDGFAAGLEAEVAGAPWGQLRRLSATRLVLRGGAALRTLFPKGSFVRIRLVNPDGQSVSLEYDRGSKQWRVVDTPQPAGRAGADPTPIG